MKMKISEAELRARLVELAVAVGPTTQTPRWFAGQQGHHDDYIAVRIGAGERSTVIGEASSLEPEAEQQAQREAISTLLRLAVAILDRRPGHHSVAWIEDDLSATAVREDRDALHEKTARTLEDMSEPTKPRSK